MYNVFLGTAFSSGKVDPNTRRVVEEFRNTVEALLKDLRSIPNIAVFCAVEDENWILPNDPPHVGVSKDIDTLDQADVFIAFIDQQISGGVQFEIGYAVARKKKVILLHEPDVTLGYFNQGIVASGIVEEIVYNRDDPALRSYVANVVRPI